MRVLVACEFSGRVRDAFCAWGHDAYSCDVLAVDHPRHIQADCLTVLEDGWDLMIAHPPCTHLAVSGASSFAAKRADGRQKEALDFVWRLANAPIGRIAIENPVSILSTQWRKPDQIFQPWDFGHSERKTTCLWLKNLPNLAPTSDLKAETLAKPKNKQNPLHYLPPTADRWALRSLTYQGVAYAMASQWGIF